MTMMIATRIDTAIVRIGTLICVLFVFIIVSIGRCRGGG